MIHLLGEEKDLSLLFHLYGITILRLCQWKNTALKDMREQRTLCSFSANFVAGNLACALPISPAARGHPRRW
jgi:hypothetical protein